MIQSLLDEGVSPTSWHLLVDACKNAIVGGEVCKSTLGQIIKSPPAASQSKNYTAQIQPQILRPKHSVAFVRMIAHTLTYTLLTFWQLKSAGRANVNRNHEKYRQGSGIECWELCQDCGLPGIAVLPALVAPGLASQNDGRLLPKQVNICEAAFMQRGIDTEA